MRSVSVMSVCVIASLLLVVSAEGMVNRQIGVGCIISADCWVEDPVAGTLDSSRLQGQIVQGAGVAYLKYQVTVEPLAKCGLSWQKYEVKMYYFNADGLTDWTCVDTTQVTADRVDGNNNPAPDGAYRCGDNNHRVVLSDSTVGTVPWDLSSYKGYVKIHVRPMTEGEGGHPVGCSHGGGFTSPLYEVCYAPTRTIDLEIYPDGAYVDTMIDFQVFYFKDQWESPITKTKTFNGFTPTPATAPVLDLESGWAWNVSDQQTNYGFDIETYQLTSAPSERTVASYTMTYKDAWGEASDSDTITLFPEE